uniref:MABP domain-containing protein n=1 Tax=Ciona savignyi TaxID=51511 RepID=H2Z7P6_CIOSA
MNQQPITNVCIVAEKNNCPPRYEILDRTIENEDADFWKDGLFKSKVRRYICFTRTIPSNQLNQVITDMALVGAKDPIPNGYTAIKETSDTREQALKKHTLCVRYIVKTATSSAISDIMLCRDNYYKEKMYTLIGELNGIYVAFKLSAISQSHTRPAPPPPVQMTHVTPGNAPSPVYNNTAKLNTSQLHNPVSGIDGIEWKLHDRLLKLKTTSPKVETLENIEIRTRSEVVELCAYDFSQEKTILYSS